MGQPVVHFEIGCRDSAKAQAFYAKLFDWNISPYGPAAMISTGQSIGIQGHISSLGHEPHNYVAVYVQVDDLQAYLDKAAALGGKTLVPPTEVPGGQGAFAWLTDPEGTIVGLWKPAART
jgi:predicted enzyme related to lactoylglutathione lyase